MSDGLLGEFLREILVAVHQILDDHRHLHHKFKLFLFFLVGVLKPLRILIEADLAGFFCPGQRLLVLCFVVNFLAHPADDLHLIHGLHPHTQVRLDEIGINDGTADSHCDGTDLQVGFSSHGSRSHSRTAEAQQFFSHILRNRCVVRLADVMAVNAESRQSLLRMGCQHRCQIYGARTLRSVEAPNGFDGLGIHVHGLRSIAPTGCHGQGDIHAFPTEFFRAGGRLSHPADGGVGDHNLHRFAIGIFQVFLKQFRGGFCHVHGLLFQRSAHIQRPPAPVDGGTDTDDRISPD